MSTMEIISEKQDKFLFSLEDLLVFVYPSELQHPLAAGRLFAFAMYGPLNAEGKLCSGARGTRVVAEYELDQMCLQLEKEDIIQIYLHNPNDMPLLTIKEQDAIVSQADAHLKREKGKAMLPKLSKETVRSLFEVSSFQHITTLQLISIIFLIRAFHEIQMAYLISMKFKKC